MGNNFGHPCPSDMKMGAVAGSSGLRERSGRPGGRRHTGLHHSGPDALDVLPILKAWVERGVAPDRVIASHSTDGSVDRTRPLCLHPQVARYVGTGSVDDAENFRCEIP